MSHSNNDPRDPFIEELTTALSQAANSVSPAPDFAQQVRRRLRAGERPQRSSLSLAALLPPLRPIGSVALVALLLITFAWALSGHGLSGFPLLRGGASGAPTPTATPTATQTPLPPCSSPAQQQHYPTIALAANPPDHSIAVGRSASDKGITITLLRVYADATQTVVTFTASPDDGSIAFNAALYDAAGVRYGPFDGGDVQLSNGHYLNTLVFHPLRQSDLGAPQRLTFRVTSIMGPPSGNGGAPSTLNGTWDIPFTMTPEAGTAIPLSLPAQTHAGVTIQLEEMDVAPAGGGLDGQSGGVRVRYRISNLPAAASVGAVLSYPTNFVQTNSSSISGPGSFACHNLLTLRLANGHVTVPGAIAPVAPVASGDVLRQTVGASGTVEVEAIFFAPALMGSVTFTINNVAIIEWRDGKSDYVRAAQGPWVFTAPLTP